MSAHSNNNSKYSSVVIVGSSGNLGSQITKAFLNDQVKTHILVRKGSENKVEELIKLGALKIEGDLVQSTVEELAKLFKGIDVIVSAVSGDATVTYDGQLKLLNAAKLAGVKKFVPSSYGFNFDDFLQIGDAFIVDPKKKLIADLKKNQDQVDYLLIHNAVFYSYAFYPGFLFEKENDTVKHYGDLNVKIQLTDTADIAKYVVKASLNPTLKNRSINVAGDEKTFKELVELAFGPNVKFEKLGSSQDLKDSIHEQVKKGFTAEEFLPIAYKQLRWVAVSGVALPPKLDNDLFDFKPLSLNEYVKKNNQKQ